LYEGPEGFCQQSGRDDRNTEDREGIA